MCYFFFFQAEDGIRDGTVTGVQTCALPISQAVVERPVRGGEPALNPLETARERHALVFHVIERGAIPGVLGPAREREVVIVCDGRAGYRALPVRIRRPECRIGARLQSAAQRVRYAGTRILPPNGHLTPNDRTELRGVRQLQTRGRRRRGHVAVILDG